MSRGILTGSVSASPSSPASATAAEVLRPAGVTKKTAVTASQAAEKGVDAEKVSFSRGRDTLGRSAAFSASSSCSTVASRKLSRGSFSGPHTTIVSTEPLSDGSTCSTLGTLQREILLLAYTHGALKFGSFPMKGGRKSPFVFKPDCLNNGEAFELLAKAYAYKIVQSGISFDVLFGTAHKGTPLVACTSMVLAREYAMPAPFVYDRKEPGEHGDGGQLIGAVEAFKRKSVGCASEGSSSSNTRRSSSSSTGRSNSNISTRPARVVLLDDMLPAVESIRETLAMLHAHFPEAEVAAVCVLLDTQERDERDERLSQAQLFEVEYTTKVLALLTMTDILHFLNELIASGDNLEARSYLQKVRNSLLDYQRAYTVTDELLSDVL